MEDVCKICKRSKKDLAFESIKDNSELLERLGSDYDENGVPYWEK